MIEVNPRASRTVPYVSKATGIPLAKIAARLMTGAQIEASCFPKNLPSGRDLETGSHYFVKSPVFPMEQNFLAVDTVLGPERKSTGEVMGVVADQLRGGLCQSADCGRDNICR